MTTGSPGRRAEQAADPRRWPMLRVLLVATFMVTFDLFAVNVAAPSLERSLHASQAALELVVGGYAFTYASALITGGRLGDLFGHRRLFLAGTLAFTAVSLLCGLAQTPGQLVLARLLQGITGAAMVPQVLALITAVFPPAERPRALSLFGVVAGVAAVAGQVLGGALLVVDVFGLGWRVVFLINVPIGIAGLVLAPRLLPESTSLARPRLDPLGAIGVSGSLALALIPLVLGRTDGWPTWTWVSLAASAPLMVLALTWERVLSRRGGQPLLDLALFRERAFSRGLVVNVGAFASFHSFLFVLTLVLQRGLGQTPLQAGLTFCPLGIAFAVASVAAQRLVARHGARVITFGMIIAGVGLVSLLAVLRLSGAATSGARLIGPMVVIGLGNGLAVPALLGAVLAGVRAKQAGAGAGVLTTAQQFASATGIAVLGSIFFEALGSRTGVAGYVSALEWVAACSLALALAAAVLSTLLPRPVPAVAAASPSPRPHPASQRVVRAIERDKAS